MITDKLLGYNLGLLVSTWRTGTERTDHVMLHFTPVFPTEPCPLCNDWLVEDHAHTQFTNPFVERGCARTDYPIPGQEAGLVGIWMEEK